MAITTRDEVKKFLQITVATYDDLIDAFIPQAEADFLIIRGIPFDEDSQKILEEPTRSLILGKIHPDLRIKQLNFNIHPEAFRACGLIKYTSNHLAFYENDPTKQFKLTKLSEEEIAVWGIIPKPTKLDELWQTIGNFKLIQLPFYLQYMDKALKKISGNSPSRFHSWAQLSEKLKYEPQPLVYATDYRGLAYFGFLDI